MSGQILRVGTRKDARRAKRHDCELEDARLFKSGTVWRCHECGRRWTRTFTYPIDGPRPVWRRRRWPWPRRVAADLRGEQQ